MSEQDSQSESQEQQPESRFSQEQYEMLLRCSEKNDMTEWNKWREEHPSEEILLNDASFVNAFLMRANLANAKLERAHLEHAILDETHLENAYFMGAHLEHADLWKAHLENAIFEEAHLENAHLGNAHLENASLKKAHLGNAHLRLAHLENALLREAHLENADLERAYLRGSNFSNAFLQGTNFRKAIVDGETLIWGCKINKRGIKEKDYTDFAGVGLYSARVQPQIKQLLEYNIRKSNWSLWYRGKSEKKWVVKLHQLVTSPVRWFWSISDYGLRTWRIILWFFGLAIVFAFAYFLSPNCVMVYGRVGEIRGFVHALYFSVVTMTTLGFGDIAANPDSWQGQVLLMVQVIFGYVLLGALVTRFAVLFTSGGPAGNFAEE